MFHISFNNDNSLVKALEIITSPLFLQQKMLFSSKPLNWILDQSNILEPNQKRTGNASVKLSRMLNLPLAEISLAGISGLLS